MSMKCLRIREKFFTRQEKVIMKYRNRYTTIFRYEGGKFIIQVSKNGNKITSGRITAQHTVEIKL